MSGALGESTIFAPGLLDGRVALVTGGGTGLGKATALELARCGAAVTIAGRRAEVLQLAAEEIEARGIGEAGPGGVDWVVGDVRERGEAERLVQSVLDRHGRMDLLVNNAGGQYFTPAELIVAKGWRAVWRLNVDGMLNMSAAAFELAFRPAGAEGVQTNAGTPVDGGTAAGGGAPAGGGTLRT